MKKNDKKNESKSSKKIIIVGIICAAVVLIAILAVVMIKSLKPKPEKIALDKNSFNDYIIVKTTLRSVDSTSRYRGYYTEGRALLKVSASLKKDVKFENISFNGQIETSGLCWAMKQFDFELEFDKNGSAEYEHEISVSCPLMKPDKPNISPFYNPKLEKGQFLINKDQVLITKVNGYVYDIVKK